MKIGIVLCANLEKAQYLYKYVDLLDSVDCTYDIIYWNRNLSSYKIKCRGKYIAFNEKVDSFKPLIFKIKRYIRYVKFVHKVIKNNHYDGLILLTTPTAIVLSDLCMGKYSNKYLFDYRDITKEYFFPYKKLVQKLAYTSKLFVTSSPGYLANFNLEKINNWVLCHNTYKDISFKKIFKLNQKKVINIAYWGAIRQVEYNKKICEIFGNDERYEFTFHGEGAYEELRRFCVENEIKNIHFTGRYFIDQINEFAQKTDILFNAYETDYVTTPSLAVKVYDSLVYQLPLIVSKNSFMESYLKKNNHVFVFSLDDKYILDKLYNWYFSLDEIIIEESLQKLQKIIEQDENEFKQKLYEFVKH